MGRGSFDTDAYRTYTTSTASMSRAERFASRGLHDSLDPKKMKGPRESRDSVDSPEATPIIIALDVTGSMGSIADQIAKNDLGVLFNAILDRRPVAYPHLMFMGIGDVLCDRAPIQISQFEADNRIVEQLTTLFLEGGGGGNNTESYDAAWYMAAHHTVHDAYEKRGRRGYLFTVGDEEAPTGMPKRRLEQFVNGVQGDVQAALALEAASRMYDVYHVIVEEGSHARAHPDKVSRSWTKAMGQRVLKLADHTALAETIVAAIQLAEGATVAEATTGWGRKDMVVSRAVGHLGTTKRPRLGGPSA